MTTIRQRRDAFSRELGWARLGWRQYWFVRAKGGRDGQTDDSGTDEARKKNGLDCNYPDGLDPSELVLPTRPAGGGTVISFNATIFVLPSRRPGKKKKTQNQSG